MSNKNCVPLHTMAWGKKTALWPPSPMSDLAQCHVSVCFWLIDCGISLLLSDIYESASDPQDVFQTLFRAGVCCCCNPINREQLCGKRAQGREPGPLFSMSWS